MHVFVQACILGLLTGGVYALMASGLALGFGVMRVINVAQGALIILGAYLSYTLYGDLGLDPFVGLIVVAPAMLVLGIGLQLVFLRPLRDEEREELSLLVTWAVALGIEGLLSVAYQTTYRSTVTGYALREAVKLGLLEPEQDGERFRVPSPRLLHAGAELVAAGIPLDAVLNHARQLARDTDRIAARFVGLVTSNVIEPYGDRPFPKADVPRLTELLRRLRPLAEATVDAYLARAMEERMARELGEHYDRLMGHLGESSEAS